MIGIGFAITSNYTPIEKPRHSVPEFCIVHECDIVATAINTQHPTATLQLSSTQRCNVNHSQRSSSCIDTLPHCKSRSFPRLRRNATHSPFSIPSMKISEYQSRMTHLEILRRTQYLSSTPSAASSGSLVIQFVIRVKEEFRQIDYTTLSH